MAFYPPQKANTLHPTQSISLCEAQSATEDAMQAATHQPPAPLGAVHAKATSQPSRNLKTFPQFCRDNPAFTEGGLRWVRFCSMPGRFDSTGKPIAMNGFADSFVNVGRRVYVDEDRFFEILREQNGKGAA